MFLFITFLYIRTYYYSFWNNIRNKHMYSLLWFSCITDHGFIQTPIVTVLVTLISGSLSFMYIFPFAYLYMYMLSYIVTTHKMIIHIMNINSEIF
jgi:hypothetical protein